MYACLPGQDCDCADDELTDDDDELIDDDEFMDDERGGRLILRSIPGLIPSGHLTLTLSPSTSTWKVCPSLTPGGTLTW